VERISGNLRAPDAPGPVRIPHSGDSSARFVGAATVAGTTSSLHPGTRAGSRRSIWVVLGGILAAAGLTTVVATVAFRAERTPPGTQGALGTGAPTAAAAAVSRALDSMPTPSPPVSTTVASPPATADPPEPKDAASTAPAPNAARGRGVPPRSTASPHDGRGVYSTCDPPFILDDQGRKHFKPECYASP
jgi:serine/threonine-protein kinase